MQSDQTNNNLDLVAQLTEEFRLRCLKNPSYSVRAFATFLDVDQSNLNKVLNGSRPISKKFAEKVFGKLGFKQSLVDGQLKKYPTDNKYVHISEEEFSALADWRHLAVCESLKINDVATNVQRIAHHIGLEISEVQQILEALEKKGIVRKDRRKWSVNARGFSWHSDNQTTELRRALQKSLLEKSIDALETVEFEERDHGSLTIAVSKERMPEFKEKLRQLRQDLAEFFNDGKSAPDEVYQLTMSFFPLTSPNRSEFDEKP